jgi:hypothetical protein
VIGGVATILNCHNETASQVFYSCQLEKFHLGKFDESCLPVEAKQFSMQPQLEEERKRAPSLFLSLNFSIPNMFESGEKRM